MKVIHKPTEIVRGKYYTHPDYPKTEYLGVGKRTGRGNKHLVIVKTDVSECLGAVVLSPKEQRQLGQETSWSIGYVEIA